MIIDAHYHLDPRMESVPRLVAEMDRFGIERVALIAPLVDPFRIGPLVHRAGGLMRWFLRSRFPAPGRFLYRTTVTSRGRFSLLGRTFPIYQRPDNDAVAAALRRHPARFLGWLMVNPVVRDPMVAVARWIEGITEAAPDPGWVGIKAHPFWHRYPVRLLDDVARWCAEREQPMLVHLGDDTREGASGDYRYLPRRHRHLRIIYAHAGVPHYQALWAAARGLDGVLVDLSGPYLDERLRRDAVEAMSASRCLYGSDGPYDYPDAEGRYDHGAILGEIRRLPLGAADIDRILGDNFAALVGSDR